MTIDLPGIERPLAITARGAPSNVYVASLTVNGAAVNEPVIFHEQIAHGGEIVFEMSAKPEPWAYNDVVSLSLMPRIPTLTMLARAYIRVQRHLSSTTNSDNYSSSTVREGVKTCPSYPLETVTSLKCTLITRHQIISQGLRHARTRREGR